MPLDEGSKRDSYVSFSVIQFVDREIEKDAHLTVEKIERLREIVLDKIAAIKEAEQLAFTELQRRLDVLNHAHADMVKDREGFLSKPEHLAFYREFQSSREGTDKRFSAIETRISNAEGRGQGTLVVLGIALVFVQIGVALAVHFWK